MFPPYYMLHRTLLLITVKSNFHAADYHSYKMQDKQEENLMRPEISWIRKGKCHAQAHGMRHKGQDTIVSPFITIFFYRILGFRHIPQIERKIPCMLIYNSITMP